MNGPEPDIRFGHVGAILYSPQPGAVMIPEQDCLRVIVSHPAGTVVGEERTKELVKQAAAIHYRDSYKLLASMILPIFNLNSCGDSH